MSLAVGTRLGPCEILGLIGAGGVGEVHRAKHTRLDRTVAIKVLPQELASDPERRTRFEREALTISGLNHPHICTLHDVGDANGIAFLVMEHLEGETRADPLRKGPLHAKLLDFGLAKLKGPVRGPSPIARLTPVPWPMRARDRRPHS